jgi:hypothetical protein
MCHHSLYLHGALNDILSANDRVQQLPAGLLCQVPPIAHQRRQLPAAVPATTVVDGLQQGRYVWVQECRAAGGCMLILRLSASAAACVPAADIDAFAHIAVLALRSYYLAGCAFSCRNAGEHQVLLLFVSAELRVPGSQATETIWYRLCTLCHVGRGKQLQDAS